MRYKMIIPVALTAAGLALAGCHSAPSGSGAPPSGLANAAKGLASIPGVQSDEQAASNMTAACVKTGHIKTTVACLKHDVPVAKREALGTCLGESALKGWAQFKSAGAQACVAAALSTATPAASTS